MPPQSALIVEVPWAEPLVGPWRHDHDPISHRGIPAHITILFPFRDPDALDDEVLASGRFPALRPHVTLGQSPDPEQVAALKDRAASGLAATLPFGGLVDGLSLFVSDEAGEWARHTRFPLRGD